MVYDNLFLCIFSWAFRDCPAWAFGGVLMKTTRIDQYICIDSDQLMIDGLKEIIEYSKQEWKLEEDRLMWEELGKAAPVILKYYE